MVTRFTHAIKTQMRISSSLVHARLVFVFKLRKSYRSSVPAAVGAGQLRASEGVLSEGAEPPEGPLQGHVPSRHRLLSPGRLRMCPALPARRQEPRAHR